LERDRSQLAATMTPGHYKVQKVDAEIAQVKTLIATQHRTIVSRIANENQAAGRRQALLEGAYQRQFKTVSEQAEQSVPIEILKREVESNRQFYQDMLQKVNSAGIATAIRASNIRVVNAARPPSTSYRPDLLQNEAVGLGASILLGLFTCFLSEGLERRNSKVQKPGDAPLSLGMRELGVIPAIKTLEAERWRSESKNVKSLPRFTSLFYRGMISLGAGVRESKSTALTTWQGPSSLITDSFHSTLDTLLYSAGQAQTGQVFAITSALPLEGKTTIATNLAFAMAAIDKRVLLIDADLRRPRLHTQFKLRNEEGLATLLVSEGPVSDATIQPVTVGNRGGLWVLTAGESKVNFSSLLARSKLAEFLEYQKSQFDAILIDTPPALLFPEAKLLGRLADGVILVVRSNQNPISVYRETVGILQHSGSTVLGTILNNWQPTLAQKHYYRSYAKA
jgi:succinoglycan biosynthesis transport protein ExoP